LVAAFLLPMKNTVTIMTNTFPARNVKCFVDTCNSVFVVYFDHDVIR
jgi:hypothetical protein